MKINIFKILFVSFLIPILVFGQSIVNSVHNLSVSGPGTVKASSESQICIFCHTPHNSSPKQPLWNRENPGLNYTLYNSSTTQATTGQPDGASILCLSCHDGTIALGNVISRSTPIDFSAGITVMPDGQANLTTDLSDDHPVSFLYNSSLASSDGELVDPATLTGPVQLQNEKLQCTSCHDAHNDMLGNFLVASTQFSDLCLFCHQKSGWAGSSHKTSTATWNGAGTDPWFHTAYSTVEENACENCHNPHSAGGHERLTNYLPEENNCFDCHNANVASKDVQNDFSKTFRHDVFAYTQVHDPGEQTIVQTRHVECADCHNPHISNSATANAPDAAGSIEGVAGVNSDGNAVNSIQFEYELCYRCHADSPDKPGSPTSRQIEQDNVRLEFDLTNPSFHPVEGQGQNGDVPSLINPWSESSIMYCSDCHASDNSTAAGPHGSINPHIMKYNYETADNTPESFQAYELCYQCHDRNSIVNNENNEFTKDVHKKHIVDADTPCNACHDPHGISNSQGNTTNNTHLINFDLSIVNPSAGAFSRLEFIDDGSFAGKCYLQCHGKNHNPRSYQ